MINVTKLSDVQITLNSDLIETIEEVPETVITLTNGKKILVKESRQEVVHLVKCYKKELFS
jgi:flagellar protein FlbD